MNRKFKNIIVVLFLSCQLYATNNWGKITPLHYDFNLEKTINMNPEKLWDGKIGDPWYEPLWFIPWEVENISSSETVNQLFGKHTGHPEEKACIVWNLDGIYKIDTVKAFIKNSWRCIEVEALIDDAWESIAKLGPYGQQDNTWQRIDVREAETEKIRITFPEGWECARYISELELWGMKISDTKSNDRYDMALPGIYDKENGKTWYWLDSFDMVHGLKVTYDRKPTATPSIQMNGYSLEVAAIDGTTVTYGIDSRILREGTQFLCIDDVEEKDVVLIRSIDAGKLKNPLNHSIERVYAIYEDGTSEFMDLDGIPFEDVVLGNQEETTYIWYGSPRKDDIPYAEIHRGMESKNGWEGMFLGNIGDSDVHVDIAGKGVSRGESLFWLRQEAIDFYSLEGKLKINTEKNGAFENFTYNVKGGRTQKGGEIYCSEDLEYTQMDHIAVSGIVYDKNTEVFVNGRKIQKSWNNRFEEDVSLEKGYQTITIKAINRGNTVGYWTKEIYRIQEGDIALSLLEELKTITKEQSIRIEGSVINSTPFSMEINGKPVEATNGGFNVSIDLVEGSNAVDILIRDMLGRTFRRQYMVIRDTISPIVVMTNPLNNQYINSNESVFECAVNEDNCLFSIDGSDYKKIDGKVFSTVLKKHDGFHNTEIKVVDQAGNACTLILSFCVDTIGPETLDLRCDVPNSPENMLNKDNVKIYINAEDLCSGIKKYEYRIGEEGEWIECDSVIELLNLDDGAYVIYVRATDNAGNTAISDIAVFVDAVEDDENTYNYPKMLKAAATEPLNVSSEVEDLTPQEKISAGHRYTITENKMDNLTVSMETGNLMNECVDFVIHGKNGFEFPVKRTYSLQQARQDGPSFVELYNKLSFEHDVDGVKLLFLLGFMSGTNYNNYCCNARRGSDLTIDNIYSQLLTSYKKDGDFALSCGSGWKWNLPYVSSDSYGTYVVTPSGSMHVQSGMKFIQKKGEGTLQLEYIYENHKSEDFTFKTIWKGTISSNSAPPSYSLSEYELILKDGTCYLFNSRGQLKEISDAAKTNVITISYGNDNLITSIKDPFGNLIKLDYQRPEKRIKYCISKVTLADGSSISYEYDTTSETVVSGGNIGEIYKYINRKELKNPPRLVNVTDRCGRKTQYEYHTYYADPKVDLSMRAYNQDSFERQYINRNYIGCFLSYLYSGCRQRYEDIFGLEFPELLTKITSPEGFAQEISYIKDKVEIEDNLRISSEPRYKDTIEVSSIVSRNGDTVNYREYKFKKKLYRKNQLIMSESTVYTRKGINATGYSVEKNIYDKKEEISGIYSQLKKSSIGVTDNEEISYSEYEWDSSFRITKTTETKGKNICVTENTYDNWGNTYKQVTTKTDCLGNKTTKTVQSDIKNTNSPALKDSVFADRKTTPDVKDKGIMNLVTKQKITIDGNTVYKSFEYDKYGRLLTEGLYHEGKWADTKTEYLGSTSGATAGLVSKVIMPSGQNYTYTYAISGNILKSIKTAVSVQLDDTSNILTSINTETGTDIRNGQKVYEIDGNGTKTTYSYDHIGRMVSKDTSSAGGYLQEITYDDTNNTVTVNKFNETTDNGTKNLKPYPYTKYYFDSKMNVIKLERFDYSKSQSNPNVIAEYFEYDSKDNLLSYTDANENNTRYTYDELGRVTHVNYADGFIEINDYDDRNNTVKTNNPFFLDAKIEYVNFDGNPVKTRRMNWIYEGDVIRTAVYDCDGRITEEKDAVNYKTNYTYTPFSSVGVVTKNNINLLHTIYSDMQSPYFENVYDEEGRQISSRSGINFMYGRYLRTEDFKYNGLGNKLRETKSSWYNGNYGSEKRYISYSYDKNGNKTGETITANNTKLTKTYTYNKMNLLVSQTDENGVVTTYEYDRDGNNTKITEDGKYTSKFFYNDFGKLVKAELPAVPGNSSSNTILYDYDNNGNLVKQTESDGRVTVWKYDSRNRKIYESVGNCTTKGWTYYSYGKVRTEHTGCSIDADGNVSGGIKTYFSYDNYGRLSVKAYPDGRKESYSYDKKDNIISITYADESSKKYEYNTLGFVTKETDEEDKVTEHYYNVWGEETYRIENNVDGNIEWEIYYDIYGQRTKETQNTSRVWTYAYDERGLLIKKTDPKGIETVFSYDKCGRLLNQNSEYGEQTAVKSYEYDRLGNLTKGTDGAVVSSITCDNAYALPVQYITKVNSTEMKTEYGYDNGQRLNYIKYHDSREFNFTYNTAGFLTSIGKGQATGSDLTAYASGGTYDSSGHLNKLTTGSGLDRTESWNAQTGNLDSYSWGLTGNIGNSVSWNSKGNVESITKNGIERDFGYDRKNQLTKEKIGTSVNTWEYDDKGNRKKTNGKAVTCYQYSDLIKKDGTWYYNYDRNGNLVAKGKSAVAKTGGELYEGWSFNTSSGEIWQYEYDNFNRLVKVSKSMTGTKNLKVTEINTYDYRDLLVYRKCETVQEYFEYMIDGTLIYEKKDNSYRDYVYANGKIWCELQGTSVYYHHTDYLGTTEYITDSSNTIVWSCEYEAFGKVVTKTGNSFVPCYTGKMLDEVTGLYYFNARWYDPNAGRFITQDPARDGVNWYIYCLNNPLVFLDPDGLDTVFADFNLSTSTMTVTYYSTSPKYGVIGTHQFSFSMTNNVRNELNHQRENPDVTTTPLQGNANWYYPRQFPIGLWKIGQSIPKDGTDPYLGEVFIPTDAHQEVPVYGVATSPMPEKKDGELPNSNGTQEDTAYGFHYSASSTTLGCGKGDTQENINKFAQWSDQAINSKDGASYVYVHK